MTFPSTTIPTDEGKAERAAGKRELLLDLLTAGCVGFVTYTIVRGVMERIDALEFVTAMHRARLDTFDLAMGKFAVSEVDAKD